ncbi:unnamed protein product, partial [Adineta ricciae]
SAWPTYIRGCSFDGGFNTAVSLKSTHFMSIANNVIYNTYRSALTIISGRNNIIDSNLVTTVYWSGTAQSRSVAEKNTDYDAAITTDKTTSVVMTNNLVAGVERLAFRIKGDVCPGVIIPSYINNTHSNNEVHSAMAGVSIWPNDRGSVFDRQCLLIKGFKVYKAWYYGLYINSIRNVTIDSCTSVDNYIGIFAFVVGPAAESHQISRSRVVIQNSVIVGSITPNDCNDKINLSSSNIQYSTIAMPTVSQDPLINGNGSRVGVVYPLFSISNGAPIQSWTNTISNPSLDGSTSIRNTTIALFNDVCGRHDTVIQVPQSNTDAKFPIETSSISRYNVSDSNIIFNGEPDIAEREPAICNNGIYCDGRKKNLLKDLDGTIFSAPTSAISQADIFGNTPGRGIDDNEIPSAAKTDLSGQQINISVEYPYRGIARSLACSLQKALPMYICDHKTDYYLLIIESMVSYDKARTLAPVAILSASGYIDLLAGPRLYQSTRLPTFTAIVHSDITYKIYFHDYPPQHIRFRLINANPSVRCIVAVYYNSIQQIDVYANGTYVSPTNRNQSTVLTLLDEPNKVNLSSPIGANYYDRTYRLLYFLITGDTTIEAKESSLLILGFGLRALNDSTFYTDNVASNLAYVFGFDRTKIRRVKIVKESRTGRSSNNEESSVLLIEIRDEPRFSLQSTGSLSSEVLSIIAAKIINTYQSGELTQNWKNYNITGDIVPTSLNVQEPLNDSNINLRIINRTKLWTVPDQCRQQSPCTIQPIIIAYDSDGNVIEKLGSNDHPWQVKATIVNQPNVTLPGAIANYTNGQTQYTLFGLPNIGTFEVQFAFIKPDGSNSSFFQNANLTVQTDPITVTNATLAGQQLNNVYVINISQAFDISILLIDNVTRRQIGQTQWDDWKWTANVTIYTLPKFQPQGTVIKLNTSRSLLSRPNKPVTIPDLTID